MSMSVEYGVELPSPARPTGRPGVWEDRIRRMMAATAPGQWTRFKYQSSGAVSSLKRGVRTVEHLFPDVEFEYASRTIDGEHWAYVRWTRKV